MFFLCWNLRVGADIYAFYNRVVLSWCEIYEIIHFVLSCLAGCHCNLWMTADCRSGGDQSLFRGKCSQHQAPLPMQTIRNLEKNSVGMPLRKRKVYARFNVLIMMKELKEFWERNSSNIERYWMIYGQSMRAKLVFFNNLFIKHYLT